MTVSQKFTKKTLVEIEMTDEEKAAFTRQHEDEQVIQDYAAACTDAALRTGRTNFESMHEVLRTKPTLAKRALALITQADEAA